jgi:hypothetical protein
MSSEQRISSEDVRRAAEIARAHEHREKLGALALDVLSRQAEGRVMFAGKEYVAARAEEHAVSREAAETPAGNLLGVLERGPDSSIELALVAALAVAGLEARIASSESGVSALARFVRHADWLEVASPYRVLAFVDAVLDAGARERVWQAAADACIEARDDGPHHDASARAAARIAALGASESDAAKAALARVAEHAKDPMVRALAAWRRGDRGTDDRERVVHATLHGRVARARRGTFVEILRLVTGLAAAEWLLRGIATLLGFRRTAEVELVPGGVRVRARAVLLGRTVRERDETFTSAALGSLARRVRYPTLPLLVGALALSLGVLTGGLLVFDGVRSGETFLLLAAALAVLGGAGLDLALDVLVPGREGRVAVDLVALPDRRVRVDRVDAREAERFLDAVRARLG